MFKSYLTTAWRNIRKNKLTSFLNIGGLAIGMAVALLIGFWVWDELRYNRNNEHYDALAQLMRRESVNGEVLIAEGNNHFPVPLATELRKNYPEYIKEASLVSDPLEKNISTVEQSVSRNGIYAEPSFTSMFSFDMVTGTTAGLSDPQTILISNSLAIALFGSQEPTGRTVQLNKKQPVRVIGVYKDIPLNNKFAGTDFICPFNLLATTNSEVKKNLTNWNNSSFNIYLQTQPGFTMRKISAAIKDLYWPKMERKEAGIFEPTTIFLHPMKDWHLRSVWENGIQSGGRIGIVRLFAITGIIVLLLACINFMNLSTARSERRAREVGIRKTFGSLRSQLISQFLGESFLTVLIAFVLSAGLVYLSLGWFNEIAQKQISFSFANSWIWIIALGFIFFTSLIAGSYPALYLSSFMPSKVLKGSFKAGKASVIPRRVMTCIQFTASIALIICTAVVYKQISYAQSRPVGYNRTGLIRININAPELSQKHDLLQRELLASGGAIGYAQSSSSTTENNYFDDHFEWEGKDEKQAKMAFALTAVTWDFGKTVGWEFTRGRDFSRTYATDNKAIVLNEAAVKYMRIADPVGKQIKWNDNLFTIIGVIKDMVMESPYKPVRQSLYFMVPDIGPVATIRLDPTEPTTASIGKISSVFKKISPATPFEYSFVDEEYGRKFAAEQQVGLLSGLFAVLAVLISCLGIFGLSVFVVQQRMRELSLRKVLGASPVILWRLLVTEFIVLVSLAFLIAVPLAHYFAADWLQQFEYRTELSWWIFAVAGAGSLLITLLTVSTQAIRAAFVNPVKNLRGE